jgi:uncharacterized membrane protein
LVTGSTGINDAGQVSGGYGAAWLWNNSVRTYLTPPGVGVRPWASTTPDKLLDIPFFPTSKPSVYGGASGLLAINDVGQIVGRSYFPGTGNSVATIWNGDTPTDLNTVLNYNDLDFIINKGWIIYTALGINSNGTNCRSSDS